MATPLPVTVVMPAYNRERVITRALDSIAAQSPAPPSEIIVIDDASTDATADVAERWGAQVIRLESNGGAATARNAGFAAASQPWVALLDSDDEWLPHCLDRLWKLRDDHVLVSGGMLAITEGDLTPDRYGGPVGRDPWVLRSPAPLIYPLNFLVASATLVRRETVQAVGGYDTSLRYSEDFDLWIRILEHGTGVSTGDVVLLYHHSADQKTKNIEPLLDAQERIAWAYAGRPWWSERLAESRMAVRRWDELRAPGLLPDRRAKLDRVGWLLRRPHRMRAVVGIWAWRWLARRRSCRLARDGSPSVAIFPGSSAHLARARELGGPGARVLSARGPLRAAAELAIRPSGTVLVGSRLAEALVRLTGGRPVPTGRPGA